MQGLLEKNLIIFGPNETTQPRRKNYLKDYIIIELSSLISSGEKGKPQIEALGLNFPYCHPIGLYEGLVWSVTSESNGITLDFLLAVVQQDTLSLISTKLIMGTVNLSSLRWVIILKVL